MMGTFLSFYFYFF